MVVVTVDVFDLLIKHFFIIVLKINNILGSSALQVLHFNIAIV